MSTRRARRNALTAAVGAIAFTGCSPTGRRRPPSGAQDHRRLRAHCDRGRHCCSRRGRRGPGRQGELPVELRQRRGTGPPGQWRPRRRAGQRRARPISARDPRALLTTRERWDGTGDDGRGARDRSGRPRPCGRDAHACVRLRPRYPLDLAGPASVRDVLAEVRRGLRRDYWYLPVTGVDPFVQGQPLPGRVPARPRR